MNSKLFYFCVIFCFTILFSSCNNESANFEKLNTTILNHLTAIEKRDLNKLLNTVNSEKITLILPNGKYSTSLEEYKRVNFEWFSDKSWRIEYKIKEKIIKEDLAIILTEITYFEKDEKGEESKFNYFLSLVFQRSNDDWKLIYNQNTIIK